MTASPTIRFDIFIAGDLAQAKQICREHCMAMGLCVTIEPVDYIYTGGEERGVRIGLINYPRFPTTAEALEHQAMTLAHKLHERLCQHSFTVVGPDQSIWFSARKD
jgi:hypothetical protein